MKVGKEDQVSFYDRAHLAMMSIVHEWLYGLFVDPYRKLNDAGLKDGQRILEVGYGPGFFTVPAARIVGEEGSLCAIDVNSAAWAKVKHKVEKSGLKNVDVLLADAEETGLAPDDFDLVFLFGVFHAFDDPSPMLREMHRLLKENGLLVIQKSRKSKRDVTESVTHEGMFSFKEESGRLLKFAKNSR